MSNLTNKNNDIFNNELKIFLIKTAIIVAAILICLLAMKIMLDKVLNKATKDLGDEATKVINNASQKANEILEKANIEASKVIESAENKANILINKVSDKLAEFFQKINDTIANTGNLTKEIAQIINVLNKAPEMDQVTGQPKKGAMENMLKIMHSFNKAVNQGIALLENAERIINAKPEPGQQGGMDKTISLVKDLITITNEAGKLTGTIKEMIDSKAPEGQKPAIDKLKDVTGDINNVANQLKAIMDQVGQINLEINLPFGRKGNITAVSTKKNVQQQNTNDSSSSANNTNNSNLENTAQANSWLNRLSGGLTSFFRTSNNNDNQEQKESRSKSEDNTGLTTLLETKKLKRSLSMGEIATSNNEEFCKLLKNNKDSILATTTLKLTETATSNQNNGISRAGDSDALFKGPFIDDVD